MSDRTALLALVLAAGTPDALALADEPLKPWPVANVYINMRTGERVAYPMHAAPRSTSNAVWINSNTTPCDSGGAFIVIDNPDLDGDTLPDYAGPGAIPPELNPPDLGAWVLDWGDINSDSVLDCIVVAYSTTVPDADTNGDSIGDGVVGFDMAITFNDSDNGHGADNAFPSGRACLYDLSITSLPGSLPSVPPGYISSYILTLDFAGPSPAPSLVFELGDSDGIDDAGSGISGGSIYGVPTGADLDGDTLADFSYAFRFDQSALPPSERGLVAMPLVAPILGNSGDTNPPAPPTGIEDALDLYTSGPSCAPTTTTYLGTFNFGGFTCEPGAETPFASSYLELYGPACSCGGCLPPGACNAADLAVPAGVLDFADVLAFLTAFGNKTICADLAEPGGVLDFSDVIAFISAFGAGCP